LDLPSEDAAVGFDPTVDMSFRDRGVPLRPLRGHLPRNGTEMGEDEERALRLGARLHT
jgi:hypothetical protein